MMDSFRTARVTVMPRRATPINKARVHPQRSDNHSSDVASSTLPRSVGDSSSPYHITERWKRETPKNMQKQNVDKKKNAFQTPLIVMMVLLTTLTLGALALNIYLLVRITRTTTAAPAANAVLRWNPIGITIAGTTGSPGTSANQFNSPLDIAIVSSKTLYVVDYENHRVQKFTVGDSTGHTVAGQANGAFGSNSTSLYYPTGLYVDSENNLYVSDGVNCRIQLYSDGASEASTVAGVVGNAGSSNNLLRNPFQLSFDPALKTLYIADYNNHRLISYLHGASSGTVVAGRNFSGIDPTLLAGPCGVHFDAITNSLIISNTLTHNIVRWSLGASSWTLLAGSLNGSLGNSSTLLAVPTGLTLDPMGNIYVADTLNHRIQLFIANRAEAITIAGVTGVVGSNASLLAQPYSVRLDSQLNLYVADRFNHRVQKFLRY